MYPVLFFSDRVIVIGINLQIIHFVSLIEKVYHHNGMLKMNIIVG